MCRSKLRQTLERITHECSITSSFEYTIRGFRRTFAAEEMASGGIYPTRSIFAKALEADLYSSCYCRTPNQVDSYPDSVATRDHLAALSQANTGKGTWERGWEVVRIQSRQRISVRKDRVKFWTTADGIRAPGGRVSRGAMCEIRVTKELKNLAPGFYFALGDSDIRSAVGGGNSIFRLYWHLKPEAAATYVAVATSLLNQLDIPFRTKVLSDPANYHRADAGVLYLDQTVAGDVGPAISQIYRSLSGGLRPEVPLFTRMLAPGLGLAEDPGSGMSFGQSRCSLIARGLWNAFVGGLIGQDRIKCLEQALENGRVDLDMPYLCSSTTDRYENLVTDFRSCV